MVKISVAPIGTSTVKALAKDMIAAELQQFVFERNATRGGGERSFQFLPAGTNAARSNT